MKATRQEEDGGTEAERSTKVKHTASAHAIETACDKQPSMALKGEKIKLKGFWLFSEWLSKNDSLSKCAAWPSIPSQNRGG